MLGEVVQTSTGAYVRCALGSGIITQEQDLSDLLACCGELDSNRILLEEAHLHPDFFDLSTGLAGAVLQRFANYYVKAAIVADLDGIKSQRFRELIGECNRGDQFHFFRGLAQTEQWLVA
jgi:PadR family transcriptional regulator AphA